MANGKAGKGKAKHILIISQDGCRSQVSVVDKKAQILATASHIMVRQNEEALDEFDPLESIYSLRAALLKLSQDISLDSIAIIGMNVAPKLAVIWERDTGMPLHPSIKSDSSRCQDVVQQLMASRLQETIHSSTGHQLDRSYPAIHWSYIMAHCPDIEKKLRKKQVMVGTLDSWLIYNLTGKQQHLTDYSHATQTLLFNIADLKWDKFMLSECGLNESAMPTVVSAKHHYGDTADFLPLPNGIPIVSNCSSDAATMIGLGSHTFGRCLLNYDRRGTLRFNTGNERIQYDSVDTSIFASPITMESPLFGEEQTYAIDIDIPFPEELTQWLPTLTGLSDPKQALSLDVTVPDTKGVYIVPTLSMNGGPKPKSSIAIFGINGQMTQDHLIRAYFESISYQVKAAVAKLEKDTRQHIKEITVSGPLSQHPFLMQFQADILQLPIIRMTQDNDTILGAALLAGSAAGLIKDTDAIIKKLKIQDTIIPMMDPISSFSKYNQWEKHISTT